MGWEARGLLLEKVHGFSKRLTGVIDLLHTFVLNFDFMQLWIREFSVAVNL
jgi:hypothetical protein